MLNKSKSKKADITSKQIVTIILLALAFLILLVFWASINWSGEINRDACHTSVVLRASATLDSKITTFRNAIPLKCQTDRICLNSGVLSKGCDNLVGTGIKDFKVKTKDDVLNYITDQMYDWYLTLGEEKLNYLAQDFTEKKYCLVNSIIALDDKSKETLKNSGGITYEDLFKYMDQRKTDRGTSYLQEIYKLSSFDKIKELDSMKNSIDFSDRVAIVTVFPQKGKLTLFSSITVKMSIVNPIGGIILGPATYFGQKKLDREQQLKTNPSAPEEEISMTELVLSTSPLGLIYVLSPDPNIPVYSPQQLISYNVNSLSALNCNSFESLS
jgi:hypothetical protein